MMKTSKNLLPLFAVVLGLGLVLTQSAFKSPIQQSKTELMYQYEDTDDARINDVDAWSPVTPQSESCGEGSVLPCIVKFETSEFTTIGDYLTAHPDVPTILADDNNLVSTKDGVINP